MRLLNRLKNQAIDSKVLMEISPSNPSWGRQTRSHRVAFLCIQAYCLFKTVVYSALSCTDLVPFVAPAGIYPDPDAIRLLLDGGGLRFHSQPAADGPFFQITLCFKSCFSY